MPFRDLSDAEFSGLFARNYDLAYDEDGEWVFYNGEWLLAGPPIDQDDYEYDQEEARLNNALHFGYDTYGQDEPPAPLDYPLYDYEDPRDLD